jgi:peptide/nickel transport system substrate-binding protein
VELPTLEPWMLKTKPPSERFVFERNPYYHRVDAEGHQLPYIDKVMLAIADGKLIPAKAGAGEADLQARNIRFDNYTFLKEGEERGKYHVLLWDTGTGSAMALHPNLNATDPVWRQLMRDVRFRRALSLGIDRTEINQAIYHGLGIEGGNTLLPQSPLFNQEYQTLWATFDPDQANALLDEMGLDKRDDSGTRLLPDGRPIEIVVETAGQVPEEADVLELMRDSWSHLGIKLFHKPTERDVLRNRVFSGEALMSVWTGLDNGLATADMSPWEFAPTSQQQLQWPKWGEYAETTGASGEAVDMPEAQELEQLYKQWHNSATPEERTEVWQKMMGIYADQVYTIGTIAGVPQPVVVKNSLKNVPEKGVYSWEPGAHFGMYKPDTFWIEGGAQ